MAPQTSGFEWLMSPPTWDKHHQATLNPCFCSTIPVQQGYYYNLLVCFFFQLAGLEIAPACQEPWFHTWRKRQSVKAHFLRARRTCWTCAERQGRVKQPNHVQPCPCCQSVHFLEQNVPICPWAMSQVGLVCLLVMTTQVGTGILAELINRRSQQGRVWGLSENIDAPREGEMLLWVRFPTQPLLPVWVVGLADGDRDWGNLLATSPHLCFIECWLTPHHPKEEKGSLHVQCKKEKPPEICCGAEVPAPDMVWCLFLPEKGVGTQLQWR